MHYHLVVVVVVGHSGDEASSIFKSTLYFPFSAIIFLRYISPIFPSLGAPAHPPRHLHH